MALLLDRISGNQPDTSTKLSVHQFQASLHLWQLGIITRADLISSHDITAAEESDLDFLKTKYVAALNPVEYMKGIDSVLMCAEQGRFGMDVQATFVAAVNSLALVAA